MLIFAPAMAWTSTRCLGNRPNCESTIQANRAPDLHTSRSHVGIRMPRDYYSRIFRDGHSLRLTAFVIILHAILHTRSHHSSLRAALPEPSKSILRALSL